MFGIGKDEEKPRLVGAKEKIARAQAIKRGSNTIESKSEGKKPWAPTVLMIYIMACILAYVLMIGVMKTSGLNIATGWGNFDRLMFSAGVPSFMGNELYDTIIGSMLRGLVFFLAAGILPFVTLVWIRAIDRPNMNPYLAFWGTTIGATMVFFLVKDFFGPLLLELLDIMS
jgi:hypothetical protein